VIQKDAPWVRGTLFFIASLFGLTDLVILWVLGWHKWPPEAAPLLIDALKLVAVLAVAGLILLALAFASPWLGIIRLSAGPVEIDGTGRE
jgi:hypothetical protein